MILPIFRSTYSVGRSILTLDEEAEEGGPDSIIQICKENKMKNLILVEDNLTSFMRAFKVCEEQGLDLYYGLRLTFCNEGEESDTQSDHKNIIFAKTDRGCKLLNKIYSLAFCKYGGKIDYKSFHDYWSSEDLSFVVPFYDSFIHKNNFSISKCLPDIDDFNPTFWIESNNLPFDPLLQDKVKSYTKGKYKTANVKTICYKNKEDVEAFQTYRISCGKGQGGRSSLSSPNLDHFASDEFSMESYLEKA